jgi:hypothetical protein
MKPFNQYVSKQGYGFFKIRFPELFIIAFPTLISIPHFSLRVITIF